MKNLLLALSTLLILNACNKTKIVKPTNASTENSIKNNLTDESILDRVAVTDGMFNFKDKSELIDLACYLTNLKMEKLKLDAFYKKTGVKSLEYRYDLIDLKNDELSKLSENENLKSNELYNNQNLYKKQFTEDMTPYFVRNIDWASLSFILNEDLKFKINDEIYTLVGRKILNKKGEVYTLFNITSKVITTPEQIATCFYGSLPSNKYSGPLFGPSTGGQTGYIGQLSFSIDYALINSSPCNYTYRVVMSSNGSVSRLYGYGSVNQTMNHMGNFSTNLVNGKVTNISNVGAGYYYQFYGTSSTVTLINSTIIANDPSVFTNGISLGTINDALKFSNGTARFTYNGGPSGAAVQYNY